METNSTDVIKLTNETHESADLCIHGWVLFYRF